jgi:predicted RNase H-like nuclease (RuvC/YqgF family)
MNKKLQERKKKRREREAKGKVLRRREVIRNKRKYDESLNKDVASSRDPVAPVINPYKEKLRKQKALEHNMEILRKLEEDYKKEQSKRAKLNADLEAAGHQTLTDKVRAMGEKATIAAGDLSLIEKTKRTLEIWNDAQEDSILDINVSQPVSEN